MKYEPIIKEGAADVMKTRNPENVGVWKERVVVFNNKTRIHLVELIFVTYTTPNIYPSQRVESKPVYYYKNFNK